MSRKNEGILNVLTSQDIHDVTERERKKSKTIESDYIFTKNYVVCMCVHMYLYLCRKQTGKIFTNLPLGNRSRRIE